MLVGSKSSFAIEWQDVDNFDGFTYGHCRFWIGGEPFGDWKEKIVLEVIVHSAIVFLDFKGDRHLPGSDDVSTDELWFHIDHYSNSDDPEELCVALNGHYRVRFFYMKLLPIRLGRFVKSSLWTEKTEFNDCSGILTPRAKS